MLGQMELPYLVFNEHETKGSCRFCHDKTRDAVFPPEIVDDIHSPIFVCSACRETDWKVEQLRKLFNRTIVENIIHVSEVPVIPQRIQLDMTSISPRKIAGNALRVFIYFHYGQTRFLTSRYDIRRLHLDITNQYPDLQLSIPELNETVMEGGIHGPNIFLSDCFKFRGLDIRTIDYSVRYKALLKVIEIIGPKPNWSRYEYEETK